MEEKTQDPIITEAGTFINFELPPTSRTEYRPFKATPKAKGFKAVALGFTGLAMMVGVGIATAGGLLGEVFIAIAGLSVTGAAFLTYIAMGGLNYE